MVCPFNKAFSALSADQFIEQVLVGSLRVKHLIIGDDFRFGRGREGDFSLLQAAGQKFGFAVEAMQSITVDGKRVSSSAVRAALAAGDEAQAAEYLETIAPQLPDGSFPPWPASLAGSWLPECLRRGESRRRDGSLPSALPEAAVTGRVAAMEPAARAINTA